VDSIHASIAASIKSKWRTFLDVVRGKALRHLRQLRPEPYWRGTVVAGAVGDPAGG